MKNFWAFSYPSVCLSVCLSLSLCLCLSLSLSLSLFYLLFPSFTHSLSLTLPFLLFLSPSLILSSYLSLSLSLSHTHTHTVSLTFSANTSNTLCHIVNFGKKNTHMLTHSFFFFFFFFFFSSYFISLIVCRVLFLFSFSHFSHEISFASGSLLPLPTLTGNFISNALQITRVVTGVTNRNSAFCFNQNLMATCLILFFYVSLRISLFACLLVSLSVSLSVSL